MSYTRVEGQQELLDTMAAAIDEIAVALAALGAAYEQLGERSADELEAQLFGPVQSAYGRAKRAHAEFSTRSGLRSRAFAMAEPGLPSNGPKGFLDIAVEAAHVADATLSELQDSMLPVEVGDPELRAALADVRARLTSVEPRSRTLLRTLGR